MTTPVVEAVIAALAGVDGPVEVTGERELARELGEALRSRKPGPAEAPPAAIVETTGEPDAIAAALRRVADLGIVVLTGPPPPDPVALDLYADLHVRGLTLVGTRSE
jgi:threonine dehydrogenase-like Zn-dependent dehydrogenase